MIFNNRPPEKLTGKHNASIALVIANIKDASKSPLSGESLIKVYASYKLKNRINDINIPYDIHLVAEKGVVDILQYLNAQGAIENSALLNNGKDYDFKVSLIPKKFNDFSERIMLLAYPYIESRLRQLETGNIQKLNPDIPKTNEKTAFMVVAEVRLIGKEVT